MYAHLAEISLIIFFAFLARGITGFGSATIAIPFLVLLLPLKDAVPLLLVLDYLAVLATIRIDREAVDRREMAWILPAGIAGVILGTTLLKNLPTRPLLLVLGVLVVFFGIRALLQLQGNRPISHWWALPAGLTGGTLGALFGAGAATPYVVYLSHRLQDKTRVRATFSGVALIDYSVRLVTFAVTGLLLHLHVLELVGLCLPATALGYYIGHRIHGRIPNRAAMRVIGALLLLSGISLLIKTI